MLFFRDSIGAFYFGHAETLGPMYAALGLFNDSQPLTDKNFFEMKNRAFKTSHIMPFSANLALILYECKDYTEGGDFIDDFVLRMYVNEKPIVIPACDGLVCKFSDVKEEYLHHLDNCDWNEVCGVQQHDEL